MDQIKVIAFLVLLATSQASLATTYYVATDGSDSNNGSSSSPFKNIQRAIQIAIAGDAIIVRPGVYGPPSSCTDPDTSMAFNINSSGTSSAPIRIKSETKWGAVIDLNLRCHSAFNFLRNSAWWIVEDFEIKNARHSGIWANSNGGKNISIKGNRIHHIGNVYNSTNYGVTGIYSDEASVMTIDGNFIHDIGRTSGGTNSFDHGIYSHGRITIINNVFYRSLYGWHIQTAVGFSGLIANNTFFGPNMFNSRKTGQIMLWDPNGDVTIRNNIFYQSRGAAIVSYLFSATSCLIDNNISDSTTMVDFSMGCSLTRNRTGVDPLLANPSAETPDLSLRQGSPAIDSGVATPEVITDVTGRTRSLPIDVGAYEFSSPNQQPAPAPKLTLSKSSLTFGSVPVGDSSGVQMLTVTNTGNADLRFLNITMSGDFSPAGLGTCGVSQVVPAGASCTMSTVFKPTVAGLRSGSLTITSNADPSVGIVNLSGTGLPIGNRVVNPSFEDGLASWINWGNSILVTSPVQSGRYAIRIGPRDGGVGQNISGLVANGTYTFSAYGFMDRPTAQFASFQVAFKDANGRDLPGYVYVSRIRGSSYAKYSMTVKAPPSFSSVQVRVWNNAGTSYVYVDSFELN